MLDFDVCQRIMVDFHHIVICFSRFMSHYDVHQRLCWIVMFPKYYVTFQCLVSLCYVELVHPSINVQLHCVMSN
jgi:hypothetical protein